MATCSGRPQLTQGVAARDRVLYSQPDLRK
jgi:hypothetical protein